MEKIAKEKYWKFLISYLKVSIAFLLTYPAINYFTEFRTDIHHFYFVFEKELPLIPWMVIPYFSINLLFILPVFYVEGEDISIIEKCFLITLVISCFIFLIFPTTLGFNTNNPEYFNEIFNSIKKVDKPYNLFPSLHVGFSSIVFLYLFKKEKKFLLKLFYSIWMIFIFSSVIFTHQHHLLDIVSGYAIAHSVFKIFFSTYGARS
ncbi:MAG: phosphatase PAP2 family protein [Leptospiraceae bacterium]|nr:phosphatase PAP2 family protein [Leptospiraceae bacterium]